MISEKYEANSIPVTQDNVAVEVPPALQWLIKVGEAFLVNPDKYLAMVIEQLKATQRQQTEKTP